MAESTGTDAPEREHDTSGSDGSDPSPVAGATLPERGASNGSPTTDDANTDDDGSAADEPPVRWITRRRLAKWNRPRPPRDWRWALTHVGRTLIATGILLFGFVAYQLWGTNLETARAQRALAEEFDDLLAAAPRPTVPDPDPGPGDGSGSGDADDGADEGTSTDAGSDRDRDDAGDGGGGTDDETGGAGDADAELPEVVVLRGAPLARITLPTLGVEEIVVSGVRPNDLQKGPGHFPSTPLPGHLGNSAIAGHRTTYGAPFRDVDQLEPGDEIVVTTVQGTFTYRVTGTEIVQPSDSHVVATTDPDVARLTLVSCHPVLSAAQRIIVYADLDLSVSSPIVPIDEVDEVDDVVEIEDVEVDEADEVDEGAEPTEPAEPVEPREPGVLGNLGDIGGPVSGGFAAGLPIGTADLGDNIDDAFGRGWFHDSGAFSQIALWGALLTLVSVGAYLLSRVTRRDLVGFTVGIAPFVVISFFFFQNVNRLLPPGL